MRSRHLPKLSPRRKLSSPELQLDDEINRVSRFVWGIHAQLGARVCVCVCVCVCGNIRTSVDLTKFAIYRMMETMSQSGFKSRPPVPFGRDVGTNGECKAKFEHINMNVR